MRQRENETERERERDRERERENETERAREREREREREISKGRAQGCGRRRLTRAPTFSKFPQKSVQSQYREPLCSHELERGLLRIGLV